MVGHDWRPVFMRAAVLRGRRADLVLPGGPNPGSLGAAHHAPVCQTRPVRGLPAALAVADARAVPGGHVRPRPVGRVPLGHRLPQDGAGGLHQGRAIHAPGEASPSSPRCTLSGRTPTSGDPVWSLRSYMLLLSIYFTLQRLKTTCFPLHTILRWRSVANLPRLIRGDYVTP